MEKSRNVQVAVWRYILKKNHRLITRSELRCQAAISRTMTETSIPGIRWPDAGMVVAHQTVHHDARYPSQTLPIMASPVQTAAANK